MQKRVLGKWIVPSPGTTKLSRLEENLGGAATTELSTEDVRALEEASSAIKVEGDRYPATHAKLIDRKPSANPIGETEMNITFENKVALLTGAARPQAGYALDENAPGQHGDRPNLREASRLHPSADKGMFISEDHEHSEYKRLNG
jgi:hypothetical protein